jgi:dTDP-4-amino-4,6-dideoxygalactose transaminase
MTDTAHLPDEPGAAAPIAEMGGNDEPGGVGSFYPWPLADEAVREALQRSFADGSWGRYHGPNCQRLRAELSALHSVEHVHLCSSGTMAVELALRGLKVAAGDEVILAGYDFPGNFRAIEAIGARPVLVDIEPRTWCLDPARLAEAIGPQTRAVIVSHLHGGMADMRQIMTLAHGHGLVVVEDACQAPGAAIDGRLAGTWGDVGALSFGGSKLLTAGRGGALLTARADVLQRIKVCCERGNDAFPLSELQAAVLVPQLQRLAERNHVRRAGVERILAATSQCTDLQPVQNRSGVEPSYYKLAWMFEGDQRLAQQLAQQLAKQLAQQLAGGRENFLAEAQSQRIPLDAGFRGFALRSSRRCRVAGELQHSAAAAARTVVLHHPVLLAGEDALARMIERLVQILDRKN